MDHLLFEHDATFGHRYIPHLRIRVRHEGGGYLLRTNGDGFRHDRELAEPKGGSTCRVLLLGDSTTAGDGVSNGHRYSDLIERSCPHVDVVNLAISGTGTDQQFLVLDHLADVLHFDLVVLGLLVGNIKRNVARYRAWTTADGATTFLPKPYFELSANGDLTLGHVPVPRAPLDVMTHPVTPDSLVGRVTRPVPSTYQPLPEYDSADNPAWRLMAAILARLRDRVKTPVWLFVIPEPPYIDEKATPTRYQQRFSDLASRIDVSICDPLEAMLRVPFETRRRMRFPHDPHPNRDGHAFLAAELASALCRSGL